MAYKQYIGARYVPKFYQNSDGNAEWRSGVAYEPLTIVTYNNNSYTSKQAVPATVGNPSISPNYWVATGVFNAQVAELTTKVNSLEAQVDTVQNDIDDLTPVVNSNTSRITKAENRLNFNDAEQLIFIADSYGLSRGSGTNPFIDRMAAAFPTKAVFTNASGGRSLGPRDGYDTYKNGLETVISGGNVNTAKSTNIYLVGLINDSLAQVAKDEVIEGIRALYNYINSTFSNNVNVFFVPVGCYMASIDTQRNRESYYATERLYMYTNGRVVFRWVENAAFLLLRKDWLNDDGLHPSYNGQEAIYRMMIELVKGFEINIHHELPIVDSNDTVLGVMIINNGSAVFRFTGNSHTLSSVASSEIQFNVQSDTFPLNASGRHLVGMSNIVASGLAVPITNFFIENGVMRIRAAANTFTNQTVAVFNQINIPFSSYII